MMMSVSVISLLQYRMSMNCLQTWAIELWHEQFLAISKGYLAFFRSNRVPCTVYLSLECKFLVLSYVVCCAPGFDEIGPGRPVDCQLKKTDSWHNQNQSVILFGLRWCTQVHLSVLCPGKVSVTLYAGSNTSCTRRSVIVDNRQSFPPPPTRPVSFSVNTMF